MVLNHEAALYLPYPREEADVDYQKLGYFVDEDGIEKVQVLLVATRKEVTNTYINTFAEAGLKIDVLERMGRISKIDRCRKNRKLSI